MDQLTISGMSMPRSLWIGRDDRQDNSPIVRPKGCIDIRGYNGEVTITGLSAGAVSIDPTRHFVVPSSLAAGVDWTELGFEGLSLWKIFAKKVALGFGEEGVFNLPQPGTKSHSVFHSERARLVEAGYLT